MGLNADELFNALELDCDVQVSASAVVTAAQFNEDVAVIAKYYMDNKVPISFSRADLFSVTPYTTKVIKNNVRSKLTYLIRLMEEFAELGTGSELSDDKAIIQLCLDKVDKDYSLTTICIDELNRIHSRYSSDVS